MIDLADTAVGHQDQHAVGLSAAESIRAMDVRFASEGAITGRSGGPRSEMILNSRQQHGIRDTVPNLVQPGLPILPENAGARMIRGQGGGICANACHTDKMGRGILVLTDLAGDQRILKAGDRSPHEVILGRIIPTLTPGDVRGIGIVVTSRQLGHPTPAQGWHQAGRRHGPRWQVPVRLRLVQNELS